MKTWQLMLVQLWVICFTPVWVFTLAFAPLVLAPPNPSWTAFILMILPPVLSVAGSVALWIARYNENDIAQKHIALALIILPVISVIPMFVWQ